MSFKMTKLHTEENIQEGTDWHFRQLVILKGGANTLAGFGTIFVGMLIMIIPILGWILGPGMIVVGLFYVNSVWAVRVVPLGISKFLFKNELRQATWNAHNAYENNVTCPGCSTLWPNQGQGQIVFANNPAGTNCHLCGVRLIRENDVLRLATEPSAM